VFAPTPKRPETKSQADAGIGTTVAPQPLKLPNPRQKLPTSVMTGIFNNNAFSGVIIKSPCSFQSVAL
jgi:hypothetical protein